MEVSVLMTFWGTYEASSAVYDALDLGRGAPLGEYELLLFSLVLLILFAEGLEASPLFFFLLLLQPLFVEASLLLALCLLALKMCLVL